MLIVVSSVPGPRFCLSFAFLVCFQVESHRQSKGGRDSCCSSTVGPTRQRVPHAVRGQQWPGGVGQWAKQHGCRWKQVTPPATTVTRLLRLLQYYDCYDCYDCYDTTILQPLTTTHHHPPKPTVTHGASWQQQQQQQQRGCFGRTATGPGEKIKKTSTAASDSKHIGSLAFPQFGVVVCAPGGRGWVGHRPLQRSGEAPD